MDRPKQVFTTGQVAKLCNVAPRTVAKWFDSGQLKGYRIPGSKDRRIPLNQLIRFLRSNNMPLGELETGQMRVLLVDEDHRFATALRDALLDEGSYNVELAPSVFEAGIMTAEFRPHVMLVDVSSSGITPKRFCQTFKTREDLEGITLIATKSSLSKNQGQSLVQEGFAGYLPKPFESGRLAEMIEEMVPDMG